MKLLKLSCDHCGNPNAPPYYTDELGSKISCAFCITLVFKELRQ